MCMWLRGARGNNVFFFQSGWFVVVAQCIDIQLILLDVVTMLCIKFDLLLWESQYLASHLRESGAKNLTKWNRAEFHLFYKCLFECLKLFFSQIYTHDLLLINFQTLSFLKYCSTSWLTFSIIFISVVFFSCSNHYYHFSFYSRFIEISLLCTQNFL